VKEYPIPEQQNLFTDNHGTININQIFHPDTPTATKKDEVWVLHIGI
jgi:hypothetical protein